MELQFFKYQGTGNDFVIIDNRQLIFPKNNTKLISKLCDRRFGIGADGLMLLENDNMSDFKMIYYNANGEEGSMCGNGGRCLVAFAHYLGIFKKETTFNAVDGLHYATINGSQVKLKMIDVDKIHQKPNHSFLDTGSPHHVQLVDQLESFDVHKEGKKLRYGIYGKSGSNINFVEQKGEDVFHVRTYERGVEDETYSCGTGVTAVALTMFELGKTAASEVQIETIGGNLTIYFEKNNEKYTNIFLKGPAEQVFKGTIECSI